MKLSLELNKDILNNNWNILKSYLDDRGFSTTVVAKVVQSNPAVIEVLEELGIQRIADSYPQNFKSGGFSERWNLCISSPDDAFDVIEQCQLSVHSNFETLKAFQRACSKAQKSHEVLLMIDMGDWREGFPADFLLANLNKLENIKPLNIRGLAINLSCFAGVQLSEKHIYNLKQLANKISKIIPMKMLSIGNSSALPYIESWNQAHRKFQPEFDWNLRIGEALFCGTLPGTSQSILNLSNPFRLKLPIVESHYKDHTLNDEDLAPNSFGKLFKTEAKGQMQRIILGAGRVDFDPQYMHFPDHLEWVGSSSDLTVLLNHGNPLHVGGLVNCMPNYHAIMNLALSPRLNLQIL